MTYKNNKLNCETKSPINLIEDERHIIDIAYKFDEELSYFNLNDKTINDINQIQKKNNTDEANRNNIEDSTSNRDKCNNSYSQSEHYNNKAKKIPLFNLDQFKIKVSNDAIADDNYYKIIKNKNTAFINKVQSNQESNKTNFPNNYCINNEFSFKSFIDYKEREVKDKRMINNTSNDKNSFESFKQNNYNNLIYLQRSNSTILASNQNKDEVINNNNDDTLISNLQKENNELKQTNNALRKQIVKIINNNRSYLILKQDYNKLLQQYNKIKRQYENSLNKLTYLKSKLKMESDSLINIENAEFQLENAPKLNAKDKQIQSNSLTKSYSKNLNKLASFNQLLFLQNNNYVSKNLNRSKSYNMPQLFNQQSM